MALKIALIYNYGQHYRLGIFSILDARLGMHFYFGDKMEDVKKLEYSQLSNFKMELKNINLVSDLYWQSGAVSILFKNYDTYIVHGGYHYVSTWVLLLLSKFLNKRVYLWTHGCYGSETLLKASIQNLFFRMADGLLLHGVHARELLKKRGFSSENLHVIYNSLDYQKQLLIRSKLTKSNVYFNYFGNRDPVLLYVGRLSKGKRLDILINAVENLLNKGIRLNLALVGSGAEELNLKERSKKISSRVWFFGSAYDEEIIGELFYNSSVCISPGNVGLLAMHSLVYGTPVITHSDFSSQMPEFEAITDNITGSFFIKNDVTDLENKIIFWLSRLLDQDLVKNECYKVIDELYNPNCQFRLIEKVIFSAQK